MSRRKCTTCGEDIFFIKNPEGRFVPMNQKDKRCHFETCTVKPNPGLEHYEKRQPVVFNKSKIKFAETQKCHKLSEYGVSLNG